MNRLQKVLVARGVKIPSKPVRFRDVLRLAGVSNCYAITMTGRCGSTWLATSISQIEGAGNPLEYLSDEGMSYFGSVPESGDFIAFIVSIIQSHKTETTFGFKIDGLRLSWLEEMVDFEVEADEPLLSWIDMRRLNIVRQALSFVRAKRSGVWHISANQSAQFVEKENGILDADIWKEVNMIAASEKYLDSRSMKMSRKPLRIFYEEILESKEQLMLRLLVHVFGERYLSLIKAPSDKTLKLQTSHQDDREFQFWVDNMERLNDLYCSRGLP